MIEPTEYREAYLRQEYQREKRKLDSRYRYLLTNVYRSYGEPPSIRHSRRGRIALNVAGWISGTAYTIARWIGRIGQNEAAIAAWHAARQTDIERLDHAKEANVQALRQRWLGQ